MSERWNGGCGGYRRGATRARSLEPLGASVEVGGLSKSAVRERFVVGPALKLAVLMIDEVHFAEHVVEAAVGIDHGGRKHVQRLYEGATENTTAVKALLADLAERGLDTGHYMLVVIDGAKGVGEVFGARARSTGVRRTSGATCSRGCPGSLAPGCTTP